MNEFDFADRSIEIAREIRKMAIDKDVGNRIIVSRLYYAAHHAARYLLKLRGHAPDSWIIGVHRRVIAEIDSEFVTTGLMTRRMLSHLTIMKYKRIKADYNLAIRLQEQEVDKVFQLCDQFIQECKRLEGVI